MIKNPNDIVDRLISDYLKITGDGLISAVLFGSAVSHEYHPGKSEISTIFIFNAFRLKKSRPVVFTGNGREGVLKLLIL